MRFDGKTIRTGRMLELVDYMAEKLAYRHARSTVKDISCVTICVDNVKFF